MKKQWKDLVSLYNYLFEMLNISANNNHNLSKQLDAEKKGVSKEQIEYLIAEQEATEKKEKAIQAVLKNLEPSIKKYNRLRRQIMINNAITIKGGALSKDDKGDYTYTAKGQIKMENELEDLVDETVVVEDAIVDINSILLDDIDFKILKQF